MGGQPGPTIAADPQNVKNVDENTGFRQFHVENVKKLNENTGFEQLLMELLRERYGFDMASKVKQILKEIKKSVGKSIKP